VRRLCEAFSLPVPPEASPDYKHPTLDSTKAAGGAGDVPSSSTSHNGAKAKHKG